MATIKECAQAFRNGRPAKSHNSEVQVFPGGVEYRLHGNIIAHRPTIGEPTFSWCGWYGPTTANHLNAIIGGYVPRRVGYANDRDNKVDVFTLDRFHKDQE